jgi:hypothetical protein
MATEQVLEIPIRRHMIEGERPFAYVLDSIFGGISRPDIGSLFRDLEASTSYEQFSSLVRDRGAGRRGDAAASDHRSPRPAKPPRHRTAARSGLHNNDRELRSTWIYILVELGAGVVAGLAFLTLNPGDK